MQCIRIPQRVVLCTCHCLTVLELLGQSGNVALMAANAFEQLQQGAQQQRKRRRSTAGNTEKASIVAQFDMSGQVLDQHRRLSMLLLMFRCIIFEDATLLLTDWSALLCR